MRGERFVSENTIGLFLHENGGRVSVELIPQLDAKMKEILGAALKRAKCNGRSTVMPQDI